MVIREATHSDIPALAEIHVSAWRAAYSGQMPREVLDNLTVDQRIRDWQRWLNEPGPGTVLVADTDTGVAAFCVFGPSRDEDVKGGNTGEILALNVHPKFWNCGYGKALCQAVLSAARQRRWKTITLWVLKSNERARLFYQGRGFSPDGTERFDSALTGVTLNEVRYAMAAE